MRKIMILAAVLLTAAPAAAIELLCEETASGVTACTDPVLLATCTLTPILDLARLTPDQEILRVVDVQEGPALGITLQMVTLSAADDLRFAEARTAFCVQPDPPLPASEITEEPAPLPFTGSGGSNPGLNGPDPGIYIRR